jgi:Spy/CpxP family protein refolding chaperone
MTVKYRLFTVLSSFLMVFALGAFAFGQETTNKQDDTNKQDTPQAEKGFEHHGMRGGHKGFGRHGKGFGHRGMGGGMGMRGFAKLNLSEDQKTQMKSLREGFHTSIQPQRQEMFGLMKQKHDGTLTADGEARLKDLHNQMKTAGEGLHANMMNVLTAEQKTQLETMKQEFKQKWEERRKMKQGQPQVAAPQTKENSL